MNFRGLWVVSVTLAALLLSPTPSRAGAVSYSDPEGDATGVYSLAPPRPSDPELDLRAVTWSTTADELIVTTSLTALGEPLASDGWAVTHYLEYAGIQFEVLIQDVGTATSTIFGPDGVYLRPANDSSTEYPCVCGFTLDAKQAKVTLRVELHSIGSAARYVDPRAPRPTAGAKFTDLRTTSFRVAGALLAADHAAPPDGATLRV